MPYEQQLLDGLFRDEPEVQLSDLRYEFAARMTAVLTELQDDAKERGWFAARGSAGELRVRGSRVSWSSSSACCSRLRSRCGPTPASWAYR